MLKLRVSVLMLTLSCQAPGSPPRPATRALPRKDRPAPGRCLTCRFALQLRMMRRSRLADLSRWIRPQHRWYRSCEPGALPSRCDEGCAEAVWRDCMRSAMHVSPSGDRLLDSHSCSQVHAQVNIGFSKPYLVSDVRARLRPAWRLTLLSCRNSSTRSFQSCRVRACTYPPTTSWCLFPVHQNRQVARQLFLLEFWRGGCRGIHQAGEDGNRPSERHCHAGQLPRTHFWHNGHD